MTKISRSIETNIKRQSVLCDEIYNIIGRKFPIIIHLNSEGNMVFCEYETEWTSGELGKTSKADILTTQEQDTINAWRDSYMRT